jgi:hypothetical protein
MSVVKLKPRTRLPTAVSDGGVALDEIDRALGAELVKLGEHYGPYAVTTVAMKYITRAVERARLKHRPVDDAWIRDLARRFNEAMTRKL